MIKAAENEILLKEHEKNQYLYKVVHGSFAVYFNYGTEDEYLLGIVSKGKCFGETSFLSGADSPYTVVANEDSIVLAVSKEEFQDFIVHNPKNIEDIMSSMSRTMALLEMHVTMLTDEINDKEAKKKAQTEQLKEKIRIYNQFTFPGNLRR